VRPRAIVFPARRAVLEYEEEHVIDDNGSKRKVSAKHVEPLHYQLSIRGVVADSNVITKSVVWSKAVSKMRRLGLAVPA
jgi:hypothetical protein